MNYENFILITRSRRRVDIKFLLRNALSVLEEKDVIIQQRDKVIEQKDNQIVELKPKADMYDLYLNHGDAENKKQLGELVGLSTKRVNIELTELGWQKPTKIWNPETKKYKYTYNLKQKAMDNAYMWRNKGYEYQEGKFNDELVVLPKGVLKFIDEMIKKGVKKPEDKIELINQLNLKFTA